MNYFFQTEDNDDYTYEKCIKESILAIDRENSTHLNADNVGREEVFNRIIQVEKDEPIIRKNYKTYLGIIYKISSICTTGSRI